MVYLFIGTRKKVYKTEFLVIDSSFYNEEA